MTGTHQPLLSVIVATRNEEAHIERCLRSLLEGTLAPSDYEVLVVDGQSTDRTRQIVEGLMREHPQIRWIDNPRRITPVAFNLGVKAARGSHISIVSAHCFVEPDYYRVCLETLQQTGAAVAVGREIALPADDSAQARLVMAILNSRFGIGGSFRTVTREGPVDAVSAAVFRRSAFEQVGLFDERLVRNQDNELSSRILARGMQIWMTSRVKHYYYSRGAIKALLWQNFRNGLYGVLTWRINPASFSLRHGIPFLFVLFLLLGGVASLFVPVLRWFYLGVIGLYALLDLAASIEAGIRHKTLLAVLLPLAFPALHITYGLGTLVGVFRFGLTRLAKTPPERLPPLDES